jgi:hypothetical protein
MADLVRNRDPVDTAAWPRAPADAPVRGPGVVRMVGAAARTIDSRRPGVRRRPVDVLVPEYPAVDTILAADRSRVTGTDRMVVRRAVAANRADRVVQVFDLSGRSAVRSGACRGRRASSLDDPPSRADDRRRPADAHDQPGPRDSARDLVALPEDGRPSVGPQAVDQRDGVLDGDPLDDRDLGRDLGRDPADQPRSTSAARRQR